ncbi:MAG: hypothetical protein KDA80_10350 [Planctomycetaceae bacterium]|nr:hypothetical protein [Planctomycetaceae bacterium]
MDADQTITVWLHQLREGDNAAAQRLWEQYYQRMVSLARKKLEGARRGIADEEDVALSAFKSFCLKAQQGQFPQLMDRESLWPLLVAITVNKSVDHIRRENRQKRGGTGNADEPRPLVEPEPISQILHAEPTPEFAAEFAELFERLMLKLDEADDPDLRVIAVRKMLGDSTAEIAADLDCTRRTVERKIVLIQRLWEKEAE